MEDFNTIAAGVSKRWCTHIKEKAFTTHGDAKAKQFTVCRLNQRPSVYSHFSVI